MWRFYAVARHDEVRGWNESGETRMRITTTLLLTAALLGAPAATAHAAPADTLAPSVASHVPVDARGVVSASGTQASDTPRGATDVVPAAFTRSSGGKGGSSSGGRYSRGGSVTTIGGVSKDNGHHHTKNKKKSKKGLALAMALLMGAVGLGIVVLVLLLLFRRSSD